MIDFLIKSSVCLLVFLLFYYLVLEKEKTHRFNRFYLLISIAISIIIPFVNYEIIKIIPVISNEPMLIPEFTTNQTIQIVEKVNYLPFIIWSLYGATTLLLLIRFGKNIWKLNRKATLNPTIKHQNATLVLVEEKTLPHSFLNFIFINSEDYNNKTIEDELFTHELVHVNQKHTLDILFIELLKTMFWFNPMFYFYKKAIQLNHEFLADEKVVNSYNDVPFYQNLLLQKSSNFQTIYLASNLNYLVTKKRLIMMTKKTSKSLAIVKKIAIVPILSGLIYLFCVEVVAQEKSISVKSNTKNSEITDKDKMRDSYYSGVYIKIIDETNNRNNVTLYEDLSLEDKRKYLALIPDKVIEKELPQSLFDKIRTKNMAVWINGKVKSKEQIKKYNRTDFSYYTYSFVHKNARTKRFPQEYQYTLYTKDYFEDNLKNSHLHFKGDTMKIGYSDYETFIKKTIEKKSKEDTLVKYSKNKYNSFVKDSAKTSELKIKNNSIFSINNVDKTINYYNQQGFRVNKNGEILKEFIDEENQATKKIINGKTYYIKNSSTINGVVKEKGYLSVAGKTLFYIKIGENIDYYDENGNLSDKNGNKI